MAVCRSRVLFLKENDKITIGRSSSCDILVNDKHLSGIHCSLWVESCEEDPLNYVIKVRDHSTNGIWLSAARDCSSKAGLNTSVTRIAKGKSISVEFGDVIHLKSPGLFPKTSFPVSLVQKSDGVELVCEYYDETHDSTTLISNAGHKEEARSKVKGEGSLQSPHSSNEVSGVDHMTSDPEHTTVPSAKKLRHSEAVVSVQKDHAIEKESQEVAKLSSAEQNMDGGCMPSTSGKLDGRSDLELCMYCLKEFPLVTLINHVESCSKRNELVSHSVTLSLTPHY